MTQGNSQSSLKVQQMQAYLDRMFEQIQASGYVGQLQLETTKLPVKTRPELLYEKYIKTDRDVNRPALLMWVRIQSCLRTSAERLEMVQYRNTPIEITKQLRRFKEEHANTYFTSCGLAYNAFHFVLTQAIERLDMCLGGCEINRTSSVLALGLTEELVCDEPHDIQLVMKWFSPATF